MLIHNNNEITEIHWQGKDIVELYLGAVLLWELLSEIQSCYANGYWNDEYPWDDSPWAD